MGERREPRDEKRYHLPPLQDGKQDSPPVEAFNGQSPPRNTVTQSNLSHNTITPAEKHDDCTYAATLQAKMKERKEKICIHVKTIREKTITITSREEEKIKEIKK